MTSFSLSDRAIADLIDKTYTAAADPTEWRLVVSAMHQSLPQCGVSAMFYSEFALVGQASTYAGHSDEAINSYLQHYHKLNCYEPLLVNMPAGKTITRSGLVSKEWLNKQPFYHEWLKPGGDFTGGASLLVIKDPRCQMRFSFDIPDADLDLEPEVAHLLQTLTPHFTRAARLNTALKGSAASEASLRAMLDQISDPAFIVDGNAHIAHLNEGAEQLLAGHGEVRMDIQGRLAFRSPDTQALILAELRKCLTREHTDLVPLRVSLGTGLPHLATILGLRVADARWPMPSFRALIVLRPARARPRRVEPILRSLYGLTEREAQVAALVAQGHTNQEVHENLGISLTTARNHLASAMTKMGVRRQAELVSVVSQLWPTLGK